MRVTQEQQQTVNAMITATAWTTETRLAALDILATSDTPDRVERLCASVDDDAYRVRLRAAQILRSLADPRGVDALLARLDDVRPLHTGSNIGRWCAAAALGEIGDPRATDGLLQSLTDPVPFVRACAARALGQIGEGRAMLALRELARSDEDRLVRNWATEAASRLSVPFTLPTPASLPLVAPDPAYAA